MNRRIMWLYLKQGWVTSGHPRIFCITGGHLESLKLSIETTGVMKGLVRASDLMWGLCRVFEE